MKFLALAAAATVGLSSAAFAAPVTHSANDAAAVGVTLTPPFGTLIDDVADAYIGFGADYSWGNVEGIFADGPSVNGLCGINTAGVCDLVTDVDARIVLPGTTTQGFASSVFVEAGVATANALTLTVLDINLNVLASTGVTGSGGPNGRGTATITRSVADIAYYIISGADTYGVNTVTLDIDGANAAVPVPAAALLFPAGAAFLARRRSKKSA